MHSTVSVTPFEQEILSVMKHGDRWSSDLIQERGYPRYGWSHEWGGAPVYRARSTYPTYPVINLALGRLQKKGLVERFEWLEEWASEYPSGEWTYTAGEWKLTDDAKILLGIDLAHPEDPLPASSNTGTHKVIHKVKRLARLLSSGS